MTTGIEEDFFSQTDLKSRRYKLSNVQVQYWKRMVRRRWKSKKEYWTQGKIIVIINSILQSTLIESVALYGAETQTIKSANKKKIVINRNGFLATNGQNFKNGKKKTNIEIRARMCIKTSIMTKIDKKRMQWYGHVQQIDVDRIPRLVLNWKSEGKNRRGRPRIGRQNRY